MPVLHPLLSLLDWSRFLLGFAAVVGVPGYLVLARHAGVRGILDRLLLALAGGLLLAPVLATLLDTVGLPVTPATYLVSAILLGLAGGRWPAYRDHLQRIGSLLGEAPAWTGAVVLVVAVALAVVVIGGLGDLPVPPTVHDGANHAFMTFRIAETSAYDPDVVFGPPWGRPAVPYLAGWHVSAALVARLTGLPPYVTTWYLPLVCLFLLPAFWAQMWRAWGLPVTVAMTAAALVPANPSMPVGLLSWGGLGILVGMALVPAASLLVAGLIVRPRAASALPAGIALVGLVHIHAGEVAVTLLAAVVMLAARSDELRPARWSVPAVLVLLAVLGLLLPLAPWQTVAAYRAQRLAPPPATLMGMADGLDYLWRAAGQIPALRFLFLAGAVLAAFRRRHRPLLAATVLLGLLVLGLMVWRDPVTRLLATPFYAGWVRTRGALMILAPVLVALPLTTVAQWVLRRWPRLVRAVVVTVALLVVLLVRPGLWGEARHNLDSRAVRDLTLFDDDAWQVARSVEQEVPAGAWVANSYDDGTAWGLHVGRRPHLVPCGWGLVPVRERDRNQGVAGLLERPWSPLTRELAANSVTHYFASNRYIGGRRTGDVETFGADDRFELVRREGDFALYRIRWEAEGITPRLEADSADQAAPAD